MVSQETGSVKVSKSRDRVSQGQQVKRQGQSRSAGQGTSIVLVKVHGSSR